MAEGAHHFRYVAIGPTGRRVRGLLPAASEAAAFAQLKRDGLFPVSIAGASQVTRTASNGRGLSERESADFLSDMAALLAAGSDLRTALSILGSRAGGSAVQRLCRQLDTEISGGGAVDNAFAQALPKKHAFVAALVAAGEASGDLAGGMERAAEMLGSRIKLREQLVSALSYPAFVLASTAAAFLIILFFLVPSLAPLADAGPSGAPLTLRVLLFASDTLRSHAVLIGAALGAGILALAVAARSGALSRLTDRFLLAGPLRRTTGAVVFGGFAISLGDMLGAGAPMSQALRLAVRSVRSHVGQTRLEPVIAAVREGEALSAALEKVAGFPMSVVRLAAVGEASGALGPMITRAGRIEEQAALRRIEAAGRVLGPAMIILLGGMIGLLMAGLLTSIQQIGDTALQ
jgi:general secretion pathway protein F